MAESNDVPMWCEDFDADLLKTVPGAVEALGHVATIGLWTTGNQTNGKLNHPSVWNGDGGEMLAYFGLTRLEAEPPSGYYSGTEGAVACTFLEALRDAWPHTYTIVVRGEPVWRATRRPFERLMYDLRGWTRLSGGERVEIQADVRTSLRRAAERLEKIVETEYAR